MLALWEEPADVEPPEDGVEAVGVDPSLPVEVIWWIVTGCSALVWVGSSAVEVWAAAVVVAGVVAVAVWVAVGAVATAVLVSRVAVEVVAVSVLAFVLLGAGALGALAAGATCRGAAAGLLAELEFEPHALSSTVSAQTLRVALYFRIEVIGESA